MSDSGLDDDTVCDVVSLLFLPNPRIVPLLFVILIRPSFVVAVFFLIFAAASTSGDSVRTTLVVPTTKVGDRNDASEETNMAPPPTTTSHEGWIIISPSSPLFYNIHNKGGIM